MIRLIWSVANGKWEGTAPVVTDLVLHLLLLGELDLGNLAHVVHLHSGAEHLDLVRVHRRVGDQDARVLHALRLVLAGRLVQEKT